jgi:fibro-slime domain-containing protein
MERITILTVNCGDGTRDVDKGEQCDDGNKANGDGCTEGCQTEADCTCPEAGGACSCNAVCGDRNLSSTEVCDDGNMADGDGCSRDCKMVTPGFVCRVPGRACTPLCGDSMVLGTEQCDDGNTANGDGCSATCVREPGASCPTPGQPCRAAVCGNGMVEEGESCDLGAANGLFTGDPDEAKRGCSKTCTKEPACRSGTGMNTTRACDTACGNGNIETGEACDDGNTNSGDGCSSTCTTETGFTCAEDMRADTETCASGGECLRLPVVFRDFKSEKESGGHPDFFYLGAAISPGVSIDNSGFQHLDGNFPGALQGPSHATATFSKRYCVPNSGGPAKRNDSASRCWDMTRPNLNATGKPEYNIMRNGGGARAFQCPCQFTDWSHDTNGGHVPGYTDATNGPLQGLAYVGGPNGHPQYRGLAPIVKDAASFGQWFTDSTTSQRTVGTIDLVMAAAGGYQFSSQPHAVYQGFFPIDPANHGFPITGGMNGPGTARMVMGTGEPLLCNLWPYWYGSAQFGSGNSCRGDQYLFPPSIMMPPEGMWAPAMQGWFHNFWYTTEARYLFVHTGEFSLQFYGDDDLFIYINGILVLDLGGVHQRLPGRVTVGANGMANITEGGWVDATGNILPCPSADPFPANMQARMANAMCPTAYPNCDCKTRTAALGLEMGRTYEIAVFHADRHPTESNYQLTLSGFRTRRTNCMDQCGNMVVKGAEECDDGPMNSDGTYGGCTTMCKYGPYCGDGTVDAIGEEQCDLGAQFNIATYSKIPSDGCTASCRTPPYCGDGIVDRTYGETCDLAGGNGAAGSTCTADCTIRVD